MNRLKLPQRPDDISRVNPIDEESPEVQRLRMVHRCGMCRKRCLNPVQIHRRGVSSIGSWSGSYWRGPPFLCLGDTEGREVPPPARADLNWRGTLRPRGRVALREARTATARCTRPPAVDTSGKYCGHMQSCYCLYRPSSRVEFTAMTATLRVHPVAVDPSRQGVYDRVTCRRSIRSPVNLAGAWAPLCPLPLREAMW